MDDRHTDLEQFKRGAVDLNEAMVEREKERVAKEEKALAAAAERVAAWDHGMTRAFKGIFSASQRRIFMTAAVKKMEREEG